MKIFGNIGRSRRHLSWHWLFVVGSLNWKELNFRDSQFVSKFKVFHFCEWIHSKEENIVKKTWKIWLSVQILDFGCMCAAEAIWLDVEHKLWRRIRLLTTTEVSLNQKKVYLLWKKTSIFVCFYSLCVCVSNRSSACWFFGLLKCFYFGVIIVVQTMPPKYWVCFGE